MKIFKRNAVIITVLVFVCAAVYLNWSYDKKTEDAAKLEDTTKNDVETSSETDNTQNADTLSNVKDQDETGLFYSENDADSTAMSYIEEAFAKVRLERQQARDAAAETLTAVSKAEGAAQETIDKALNTMTQMAVWSVKEAELENLIRSKGFIDCVVYLSDSGVSVTVAAEGGLTNVSAAKITDVIVSETDFTAEQLKVIEIK